MEIGIVYLVVFGILAIASILLAVIITKTLNRDNSVNLVGGKLENSDLPISDAMPYLKLTNEWER